MVDAQPPVFRYTTRRPSNTYYPEEYGMPPGHRMGIKSRRNILAARNSTVFWPYCTCGWRGEPWGKIRLARQDYALTHRKEVLRTIQTLPGFENEHHDS